MVEGEPLLAIHPKEKARLAEVGRIVLGPTGEARRRCLRGH